MDSETRADEPENLPEPRIPPLRVVLIDDHRLFAEAISRRLKEEGMSIVGIATTAAEGFDLAMSSKPDLVLVDIGLPDESGVTVGGRLVEELPEATIVAVTARSDDAGLVREAVQAGLHGFLPKDLPLQHFVDSLASALQGQVVIPRRGARAAAGRLSPKEQEARDRAAYLTPRERDVLRLLIDGVSSEQIAKQLFLSPNTVRSHVQNLLTKLHVHSRLEAVTYAIRYRLLDPDPGTDRASTSR